LRELQTPIYFPPFQEQLDTADIHRESICYCVYTYLEADARWGALLLIVPLEKEEKKKPRIYYEVIERGELKGRQYVSTRAIFLNTHTYYNKRDDDSSNSWNPDIVLY